MMMTGLFHIAAKGWISVRCQLHIKPMLYKTKPTTRNYFYAYRDNELRNVE